MLEIKQSIATSLRFILVDVTDYVTRETGILFTDVTVKYIKYGDATATTKTILTGDFRHIENGIYEIDFTSAELDTLGMFVADIVDTSGAALGYSIAVNIVAKLNSDLDTNLAAVKVDTAAILVDTDATIPATITTLQGDVTTLKDTDLPAVKSDTAAIKIDTESIEPKIEIIDANLDALKDVDLPAHDAKLDIVDANVDTLLASVSSGAYVATINIKDGAASNVQGVSVYVHNSANDDSPYWGAQITDASGNVTFDLDDGTYSLRAVKAQYSLDTPITFTVAGTSLTVSKTMTATVITPPSDPDVCTLHFKARAIDNSTTTGLIPKATSSVAFSKVDGVLIDKTSVNFTYNSGSDTYQLDVIRGHVINISNTKLGLDHDNYTVPDVATYDLADTLTA